MFLSNLAARARRGPFLRRKMTRRGFAASAEPPRRRRGPQRRRAALLGSEPSERFRLRPRFARAERRLRAGCQPSLWLPYSRRLRAARAALRFRAPARIALADRPAAYERADRARCLAAAASIARRRSVGRGTRRAAPRV